ncbi:GTP pyrophosphokinase family protein [Microbacterium sp. NPDC087868]|uniref:GTP pyrophosphokinase n=1 Tax=Microbacterium sp. NPDC087868 TaxID=3364195 RepID=UPI00384FFA96
MARRGDYNQESEPHRARGEKIRSLVEEVLADGGVKIHSVTHRVKTEESARAKIEDAPDKYGRFSDLHDLLGVRVITNLTTEVDAAVAVLTGAFTVDATRSLDKAASLSDDEFGYQSFHLVVKLQEDRARLPEWRSFAGIYFEIQVRSILQHAWAEIEHDLGYKSSVAVPREISRRFARLAGLLELADDEFVKLQTDSTSHAKRADAEVKSGRRNIAVDRDSILALISNTGPVALADRTISKRTGRRLDLGASFTYAAMRSEEMGEVGFTSVEQINDYMQQNWRQVADFGAGWLLHDWDDEDAREPISPGISLFYLYLHMKLEQEGEGFSALPGSRLVYEDEAELDELLERRGKRPQEFRRIHEEAFRQEQEPTENH